MKKFIFTLLAILLMGFLFIYGCAITDLRTELVKTQPDEARGRALLDSAWKAYGGTAWDSLESYSYLLHDHFYGFVGKQGNPYPGDTAWMQCAFLPYTFTGKVTFTEGKWKGLSWGLQAWQPYVIEAGTQEPVLKKDKDISFWLPTYQYFFELPLRLRSATVVSYAGIGEMDGKKYELVFASWNRAAPQRDIDQYVVWINPDSKLIERVDYTIRDVYPFLKGTLKYKDFEPIGPFRIPTYMPVSSNLQKGLLHEIFITRFVPNRPPREEVLVLPGHEPKRDSKD